jgi:hypothetical protein
MQMSLSETEDSFASTISEATNIDSIQSAETVGTASGSIGSTIPPDLNRPSNRPGSTTSKTKAVSLLETDTGIVSYLLFKKDSVQFTKYCNQNCALFSKSDSKLRAAVLNRKGVLVKQQANDPAGFEALAEEYQLINPQQHLASPSPAAAACLASPSPSRRQESRSSSKKKNTKKGSNRPSSISIIIPEPVAHETIIMAANQAPPAGARHGPSGTSSVFVIVHSFSLHHLIPLLFFFSLSLLLQFPCHLHLPSCKSTSSTRILNSTLMLLKPFAAPNRASPPMVRQMLLLKLLTR